MSDKLLSHERQPLGEALSAYLQENRELDWCDSRNIDDLMSEVVEPWLRNLKSMPALTGVDQDRPAFEKHWASGHQGIAPAKYVDGTYQFPAAYNGWVHWQAACAYMRPKTTTAEPYPYCDTCQRPFEFERDEPFAYCGCGTTEWGNEGRPKRPIFTGPEYIIGAKTFKDAWAIMEQQGYKYGPDALSNVEFGWTLAFHSMIPDSK